VTRTLILLTLLGAGPAWAITGREVIDTAQRRHGFSTWRDRTSSATMETYDKDTLTRTRELEISEQTDPRRSQRSLTEFTAPADVKGTLFLHLSPRGEKDEQWIWTPSTRRVRRLAEAKEDENFFGSDLTYRDLELLVRIQQWNDEEATATLVGEEDLDGKRCYVVEILPRNTEFPYARYRLWFGNGDFLLWRLDVYDRDGKVVKRVAVSRHERIQNYTTLVEMVVANVPAETHTTLRMRDVRYDQEIPDEVFRVATLARGR
jgi:outer membrane lipoprotein-sorting protein